MPSILSIYEALDSFEDTVQVTLEKEGLVIDSRVIKFDKHGLKFECKIERCNLTIRLVAGQDSCFFGIQRFLLLEYQFRLYDPEVETIPSFDPSSEEAYSYTYHGLEGERAPFDIEQINIAPSVKIIRSFAFSECAELKTCMMGDHVEEIEDAAFYACDSLEKIRLSKALRVIGSGAFEFCHSIDCIFIPPNVENIGDDAFEKCPNMRFLILPLNIPLDSFGNGIVRGCDALLDSDGDGAQNNNYGPSDQEQVEIHNEIKHRYDHLPSLRICTDPDVSVSMIHNTIQEYGVASFYETDGKFDLTPLHIITGVNTFACNDVLFACFDANPSALFLEDGEGRTPLDNLWDDNRVDIIVHLMQDLCMKRFKIYHK